MKRHKYEIDISEIGTCPECGGCDGLLRDNYHDGLHYGQPSVSGYTGYIGQHLSFWGVCHEHKRKWLVGYNCFPHAQLTGECGHHEAMHFASAKLLASYKSVVPNSEKTAVPENARPEIRLRPNGGLVMLAKERGPVRGGFHYTVADRFSDHEEAVRVFWDYGAAFYYAALLTERHAVRGMRDAVGGGSWTATVPLTEEQPSSEIWTTEQCVSDGPVSVTLYRNGNEACVGTFTTNSYGYGCKESAKLFADALKVQEQKDGRAVVLSGGEKLMEADCDIDEEIPF